MLQIAFSVPQLRLPLLRPHGQADQGRAAALGNVEIISLDGQDRTEKASRRRSRCWSAV
ncbi:MAG: hypothetical protein R2851_16730 [Caldilineaceae bacterium]